MNATEKMKVLESLTPHFDYCKGIDVKAIFENLKHYCMYLDLDPIEYNKNYDKLHQYLQGLQDAGAITQVDHETIFCIVMGID